MTWQDELRQLDDELASGQLSAEDYRRRRDDVMTRRYADEGGRGEDQQGKAATPFPPAFRWETAPPDEGNETTQMISPVDANETQIVSPQPVDTDRTQVVSSGLLQTQQGPVGWGGQNPAQPRASSDVPPLQEPNAGWTRQGPETFEAAKPSRTPRIVAAAAAVVLLLIAGGIGAFLLWGGNGTPQAEAPAADQQRPEAPAQPPPLAGEQPRADPTTAAPPPQPPLPGFAEIGGDGRPRTLPTLADLQATGALPPQEFDALKTAGASDSKLLVSSFEDGPQATLLIARLPTAQRAIAARDELARLQRQFGLQSAPTPDPGLQSFYIVDDPSIGPTVRGVYHNGALLVRIEVVGQQAVPTARRYDLIVGQQLSTLSADG
ncbi:MAG: hypothetical protein GEV09_17735 [Pseudonocardiaceae bacterium]|nr:hypothetical protein [Pseudonocardiaceae bacterium]